MRRAVWLGVSLGGLAGLWMGCSSVRGPHQEYLAPRVVGRVLDARSGAPVFKARVRHVLEAGAQVREAVPEQRGAQRLLQSAEVQTDRQGWFSLPGHKGFFLLFQRGGGYFGSIVVEHPAYHTLRTNVTANPAANVQTRRGPAADAGDLRLEPKPRAAGRR